MKRAATHHDGLPKKQLQWAATALLVAGAVPLERVNLLAWLSLALLVLISLKLREAQQLSERRLVALLQLLAGGLLAAQLPELVPSLIQLLAAVVTLAGLLQLDRTTGLTWVMLLRRSVRLLLAVLPLAALLLVLAPRFGPLWPSPTGLGSRALTGLSAQLDPGSIAALAGDPGPAARVSFNTGQPPPPEQRYWRVLVHSRFDGRSWLANPVRQPSFRRVLPAAASTSQLWMIEPSGQQAVPWDGSGVPTSPAARIDAEGQLQLDQPASQRRTLLLLRDPRAGAWRYLTPTPNELALPWGSNPRLEALGRSWRQLPPAERLQAARSLLGGGAYRYTLQPGSLPAHAGLDAFLFERRAGFCGHYASAFTALMRAGGLPARVVSGYQGGTWVPGLGGGYLNLRQSDAHAWSEVWLNGQWRGVDPSAWVEGASGGLQAQPGWWGQLQGQWWGLELIWSRWWLGFDESSQQALLERLLGERQAWRGWLLLAGGGGLLLLAQRWFGAGLGRGPHQRDPLARELVRWRRRLARCGITPEPGETLPQLARRLAAAGDPQLAAEAQQLAERHQRLRFGARGSALTRTDEDPSANQSF